MSITSGGTNGRIQPQRRMARWTISSFLGALLALNSVTTAPAAGSQTVPAYAAEAVARLAPMGRLPGSNELTLAIGLPWRNQAALTNLLTGLYDPQSTNYHQYLEPEQFTAMFGPTEEDYAAIGDFARSHGLKVVGTHFNRMLLDVRGTVADIEAAFHVKMRTYQHPKEPRTFYAPDAEPSLDTAVPVLDIMGLTDYSIPRPAVRQMSGGSGGGPAAGSGPSGNYLGNDFRRAYVPGTTLTGAGQIIGLFELAGYYTNDINAYESLAGLAHVPLVNVPLDGFSGPSSGDTDGISETSLDIEMAIAMAPGVSKVVVFEAPNFISNWNDLLNRMASSNQIKQFSSSWGYDGGSSPGSDQIFQEMAAQGQSFFQASGDGDAYTGAIWVPGASPYVTSVGGTTLTMSGSGTTYSSERVWNRGYDPPAWFLSDDSAWGSGGGVSASYTIPAWQQGIDMSVNKGSPANRNIPDVALTADQIWVIYANGKSGGFMGTSCAAPLWAGYTALANQLAVEAGKPPMGFLNPAIYAIGKGTAYSTTFHDIRSGNNFHTNSPSLYAAASGYDLCTGWGTPNGTNLINALVSPFPPAPANLTATAGRDGGVVVLNWSPSAGATNYNVKRALVRGATYPLAATTTNTTFTDAGLNSGTTYYYVVSASNPFGQGPNSAPVSAVPLSVPPISDLVVQPRLNSAIISWDNSPPATAQVFYGTDTNYGSATPLNSTLAESQAVLLTGLLPETTYYFQAVATSGTNVNEATGSFFTDPSLIITSANASFSGNWFPDSAAVDRYSSLYRLAATVSGPDTSDAMFPVPMITPGEYDVYLWYGTVIGESTNAPVTVSADTGATLAHVNQTVGNGGWQLVQPNQPFGGQTGEFVRLGNGTGENAALVIADAVRLAYTPSQDSPTDGSVPGWWANYYFGTNAVNSAQLGANGYSLFANYVIGLVPTDPASTLKVNVTGQGSGIAAVFSPFLNGRTYQLVRAASLDNPSWSIVPNTSVSQNAGGQGVISVPTTGDARAFYRLSIKLSP